MGRRPLTALELKFETSSFRDLKRLAAEANIFGSERMNKTSLISALKKSVVSKPKTKVNTASFKKFACRDVFENFSPVETQPLPRGSSQLSTGRSVGKPLFTKRPTTGTGPQHFPGAMPWPGASLQRRLETRPPAARDKTSRVLHPVLASATETPNLMDSLDFVKSLKEKHDENNTEVRKKLNSHMIMSMVVGDNYYKLTEDDFISGAKRMNMTIDPSQTLGLTPRGNPAYATPRHSHRPHHSTTGKPISTRKARALLKSVSKTREVAKLLEEDKYQRKLRHARHERTKAMGADQEYRQIMSKKGDEESLAYYGTEALKRGFSLTSTGHL